jgi:hypothetical protein
MADQETTLYHSNTATFELPGKLKDKTMHMFTLNENGPSDFNVVISHAGLEPEEKLEDFGGRLVEELGRALPKFQLKGMTERAIDGAAAIELAFSWRNDGHFMHQRQVVTVVQGATPDSRHAMLIAATCLKPFSDEWNSTFDAILASVKLRNAGKGAGANDPVSVEEAPAATGYVFVLSERRRTLRVFADRDEACRNTDPREVEQDAWTFFGPDGTRLYPRFVVANTGTLWRKGGSYVLEAHPGPGGEKLRECLHRAAILQVGQSGAPFQNIGDVRAFLDQQKAG